MEIAILCLLFLLVLLVGFLLYKVSSNSGRNIESFLNKTFFDFSKDIRETMDGTRKEVESSKDVLSSNALKTFGQIKDMNIVMTNLINEQKRAQELGKSLEYLLQKPKLRGNYGEVILEEMLDRVFPKGMWERQYSIDGREKVDAVIKYKDVIIPIDSKFPKEDYEKFIASSDENEKRILWSNYEKALKIQIASIKTKYIKPEKGTSDFALLFIPSESIYYETIAEKNHLGEISKIYEYAQDNKVVPVSPNTFYIFLNVMLMGMQNVEIAKSAKKIHEALMKVENDFEFFYNKFDIIGKSIEKAYDSYKSGDKHIHRFKKRVAETLELEKYMGKNEIKEED